MAQGNGLDAGLRGLRDLFRKPFHALLSPPSSYPFLRKHPKHPEGSELPDRVMIISGGRGPAGGGFHPLGVGNELAECPDRGLEESRWAIEWMECGCLTGAFR